MSTEEILAALIEDLSVVPSGHDPGDCPKADDDGVCDTCHFCEVVREAVSEAEGRLLKLRLGVVA